MAWRDEVIAGFAELLAQFGVPMRWIDDQGQVYSGLVLFVDPTQPILGERQYSDEYGVDFDPSTFPGLAHGAEVTVDGIDYRVRGVLQTDDGFTRHAPLSKR
jgi:hypothetical protein